MGISVVDSSDYPLAQTEAGLDTWLHVVLRTVGGNGAMIEIFLNAVLVPDGSFFAFTLPVINSTNPLSLLKSIANNDPFDGLLNQFFFVKGRAYNNSEIAAVYNGGNGLAYTSWT